jgi:hypothetical protein
METETKGITRSSSLSIRQDKGKDANLNKDLLNFRTSHFCSKIAVGLQERKSPEALGPAHDWPGKKTETEFSLLRGDGV